MLTNSSPARADGVRARVRSSAGTRTLLEIEYDGSRPPLALFAELREIGWSGVVPCGPPADAIDWSRPDPARGTRFTVRPFDAVLSASIEGARDEREQAVARARIALDRHAHDTGTEAPMASARPAASMVLAEVACAAPRTPAVRQAVGAYGVVLHERLDTVVVSGSYRGRESSTPMTVSRMHVRVDESRYDELVGTLALHGVHSIRRQDSC